MGSWFDSKVYERRRRNPWMTPGLISFAKDVLMNEGGRRFLGNEETPDQGVTLTIINRPDVASRFWYTLEWSAASGQRRSVSSQEYNLLMWRAAVTEQDARDEAEGKDGEFVLSRLGQRNEGDHEYTRRIKAHAAAVACSTEKGGIWEIWNKDTGDTLVIVKDGSSFTGG